MGTIHSGPDWCLHSFRSQLLDSLQSQLWGPFAPIPPNCWLHSLRSQPMGTIWSQPFIPVPIGGSVPSGPTRRRGSVSATWGSEAASPRQEKSWRNSVRHNLSLNECFVKAGRSDNGKGHFWAIHPANLEDFAKGDYHRRRARRRIRR